MRTILAFLIGLALALPAAAQEAAEPAVETGGAADAYDAFLNGRYEDAIAIWLPLASGGDPSAQFNIGVMYANGLGVDRDMAAAMDWWTRAARQLHVRSAHNLALAMLSGEPKTNGAAVEPDYPGILRYLKIGADAGYPNSEYTLAKLYEEGVGVEKDQRRAAELFLSASIKGFAKAQYNLGKVYRDGAGMPKSESMSLFWFIEAAERGHARAQDKMAERCLTGRGLPKDEVEALKWSILAAGQGIQESDRRRFELSARLPEAMIAEAEKRAADFAPRKGPVLNLPKAGQ